MVPWKNSGSRVRPAPERELERAFERIGGLHLLEQQFLIASEMGLGLEEISELTIDKRYFFAARSLLEKEHEAKKFNYLLEFLNKLWGSGR